MTGDLRDLVDSGGSLDLAGAPTSCGTCKDAHEHGRLYVASRAHDVEDARHLLTVLGLVDSPPPAPTQRGRDGWGRAKRSTNHNH